MRARPHGRGPAHRHPGDLRCADHREPGASRGTHRPAAHEQGARVHGSGAGDDRTTVACAAGTAAHGEETGAQMSRGNGINPASARRAVARKLAMQALYRWQLNATPWQEVLDEFATEEDMRKADRGYFKQ